jgi:hypothetical protein
MNHNTSAMAASANFDRNQARELVEKIAEDHGHIPADMWSTLPGVRKFRATSGYEPRFTSKKLLFKALY